MTRVLRYWDIVESKSGRPPTLGQASLARVMKAILSCDAKLVGHCVDMGNYAKDHCRPVCYRVAVPIGKKEQFEGVSGYRLDPVEEVRGA